MTVPRSPDPDPAFEAAYRRALELRRQARVLSRPYSEWAGPSEASPAPSKSPLGSRE